MRNKIFIAIVLGFIFSSTYSQTSIGTDSKTQIKVFEFYHHYNTSEWLKVFRIYSDGFSRGGVSGMLFFVDYQGEGAGYIEYSFPQSISTNQKPILVLHGNAADDFDWSAYQMIDESGRNCYDVYIKTPIYHVGFTFLLRGYSYIGYCTVEDSPSGTGIWDSDNNQESFSFYSGNGKIGFGTLTPDYKLDVAGTIRAEEIKVETGWADFVFHPNYNLRPLQEVNTYIQQNGHLPEIPTAKEVEENGISLGEMNAKLLQKIEELTLYTIKQQKEIEELKMQNARIDELEEIIKKLK